MNIDIAPVVSSFVDMLLKYNPAIVPGSSFGLHFIFRIDFSYEDPRDSSFVEKTYLTHMIFTGNVTSFTALPSEADDWRSLSDVPLKAWKCTGIDSNYWDAFDLLRSFYNEKLQECGTDDVSADVGFWLSQPCRACEVDVRPTDRLPQLISVEPRFNFSTTVNM